MAENQIQKMTERHRAIAEWMIANPDQPKSACAATFGMSQTWLSIIINSQIFQEYQAELGNAVLNATVIPLREKLLGVSHRAVEKLGDAIDGSQDAKFILDAADKTAKLLGYGPRAEPIQAVTAQQNNFFVVDKDALAQARTRILDAASATSTSSAAIIEPANALPAPEEL